MGGAPFDASSRLRRLEALDPLLVTLASALDVREVFRQVSVVAREVLPHDVLVLGRFSDDLATVQIHALSDELDGEPQTGQHSERMRAALQGDFLLTRDYREHPDPAMASHLLIDPGTLAERWVDTDIDPTLRRIMRERGLRSTLHVPVRVRGDVVGGLLFLSSQAAAYELEDARIAGRIASCVALALAHERLAEEARLATEARERAARLEIRVARLTEELAASGGPHRQIGVSRSWRDVLSQATKVAGTEATVLLTGESGTGKEVVARFIHGASPRREGPFVALNCAALPEQLLESELFGHEKGAFTGALAARPGRIEQAAGGVLFLDEVGEMSPGVQAKFLRVLQEREFQRLGGTATRRADVRIIAATNRDLLAAIDEKQFREDLYYRLHVFEIHLPPLRERPEDIGALLDHFVKELSASVGRPAAGISEEARQKLLAYAWPGNVRELRNAVERAVILSEGGWIRGEHLPLPLGRSAAAAETPRATSAETRGPAAPAPLNLESQERTMIEQALRRAGGNKSKAARLLGLTRSQLYTRLEKHAIDPGSSD